MVALNLQPATNRIEIKLGLPFTIFFSIKSSDNENVCLNNLTFCEKEHTLTVNIVGFFPNPFAVSPEYPTHSQNSACRKFVKVLMRRYERPSIKNTYHIIVFKNMVCKKTYSIKITILKIVLVKPKTVKTTPRLPGANIFNSIFVQINTTYHLSAKTRCAEQVIDFVS